MSAIKFETVKPLLTDIKVLINEVAEFYDLDLARKLETAVGKGLDKYYEKFKEEENRSKSLMKSLNMCFDTAREMLKEEREIQNKLDIEKDKAEYDRDYYRDEVYRLRGL